MIPITALVEETFEQPDEPTARLALADVLEEAGDAPGLAAAQLLRWQVEAERLPALGPERSALDDRAAALVQGQPGLLGPLGVLCRERCGVLTVGPALAAVLAAERAAAEDGPLQAWTRWRGKLMQGRHRIPTTLILRTRQGHAVSGYLDEDFAAVYHADLHSRFYHRGVVVGRSRLVLVTHRVQGIGAWPGLYTLRLGHAGHLAGTWVVPSSDLRGTLRLRRRPG